MTNQTAAKAENAAKPEAVATAASGAGSETPGATGRVSARQMYEIEGFKEKISGKKPNHFEPHPTEVADAQLDERVRATLRCIMDL